MLTLSVGFVIYKCSTSVPSMCCPEVGGLCSWFVVKCPEMTGGCFVVAFFWCWRRVGWGPTFVILIADVVVVTDSPLVRGRFGVGWCVNWGLMIVRGRECVEFSICALGGLGGGGICRSGCRLMGCRRWFVVHLPFSVTQRVSVLAVWVDDRSHVGSFLVEFPVSLYVGNFYWVSNFAQSRQLIVFVTVDSKSILRNAAVLFPCCGWGVVVPKFDRMVEWGSGSCVCSLTVHCFVGA